MHTYATSNGERNMNNYRNVTRAMMIMIMVLMLISVSSSDSECDTVRNTEFLYTLLVSSIW